MAKQSNGGGGPIDLETHRRAAEDARDAHGQEAASRQFFQAVESSRERSAGFLAAWKAGVERAGLEYFRVTAPSVGAATNRAELVPDFEVIEHALPTMSGGEQRFLIAMCEFYAESDIAAICREVGIDRPSMADLALLDDDRRAILIRLLDAYTGW